MSGIKDTVAGFAAMALYAESLSQSIMADYDNNNPPYKKKPLTNKQKKARRKNKLAKKSRKISRR